MDEPSFAELVERLRRGDSAATEVFVRQFEDAIRREVRFILLDARLRRVVSESDVCQSVLLRFFVELWAGRFDFQRPGDITALLKKMVRARVADLARHWMSQGRDVRRTQPMVDEVHRDCRREDSSPSKIVANAALLEEIRRRLCEQDRTILELRQSGVAWPDIADSLGGGRSPEAVRKQHARALNRVACELGAGDLPE